MKKEELEKYINEGSWVRILPLVQIDL